MGNKLSPYATPNGQGLYKALKDAHNKNLPEREYIEIESEEMEEAHKNPKELFSEGKKPKNVPKNRYANILPNDETRVILQPVVNGNENVPEDVFDSLTYINANHIRVDKINYIASQAPLPHTIKDFWLMIYQQNIPVVVMLTREMETGQIKSHKYWPSEFQEKTYGYQTVDASETFGGSIKVALLSEQEVDSVLIIRRLSIQSVTKDEKDAREVIQFQFLAWPDHGVPSESTSILKLMDMVNSEMSQFPFTSPILVHCSAGVGRTGAFILIHSGLYLISQGIPFNLKQMLTEIRIQRAGMVNSPQQFAFVYETLAKSLQDGNVRSSPRRHTN